MVQLPLEDNAGDVISKAMRGADLGDTALGRLAGVTPEAVQALAAEIPDRSRREYETGAVDAVFKQRLNAILLGLGCGGLCLEWIVRRLSRLA